MIGAADDDMKVLLAKNFIIQFESGVIVIKHWKIHNYIRADRLNKTAYEDERSLLEVKNNGAYTLSLNECPSNVSHLSDTCPSNVSIGKVRLGKDNIEVSKDTSSSHNNVERVLSEWNNLPEPIKKVRALKPSTERYRMLNSRIKEYGIDSVIEAVHKVGESDFLRRGSDKGWQIDFDWFVRPNNFPKILDGKYDNKDKPTASYYSKPKDEWDSYMWGAAIKDGYVTQDDYREWRESNGTL
jgi:hypothetical protein